MDFELNTQERAAYDSAFGIAEAHEGEPADLIKALEDEGLFSLAARGATGRAAAVLAVEAASRAAGLAPVGVHALVLPLLEAEAGHLGYVSGKAGEPVRFGAQADLGVVYEGSLARLYPFAPGEARPILSNYIYPLAVPAKPDGPALAQVEASAVQRRYRQAIGAEAVGAMSAVLDQLTAFLSERIQFGRRLGAFQALHHRMAELAVLLESSRWLVREAAWLDDDEASATAAAFVAKAARRICYEAHQLTGARGFTLDFGMHRHTLRLQLLSVEAGGASGHATEAGEMRWRPIEDDSIQHTA